MTAVHHAKAVREQPQQRLFGVTVVIEEQAACMSLQIVRDVLELT